MVTNIKRRVFEKVSSIINTPSQKKVLQDLAQIGLCLVVGTLSGGILLLDLQLKWEVAILGLMGIAVLMFIIGNPKRILLFALALTTPIYFGKAIINHPGPLSLSTGVGVGLTDILVWLLLVLILARLALHQITFRISSVIPPALAWLVLSSLSLLTAVDGQLVMFQLVFMVKMVLLCWVVGMSVEDDVDLAFVISGLMLGMGFQSLIAIYQGVTGRPLGLGFLTETTKVGNQMLDGGKVNRVQGTMGHPNTLAMYLSTGIPFALALLFSAKRQIVKFLSAGSLGMMVLALVYTLSRASWGTLVLSFAIVLYLAVWRKQIKLKAAVLILAGSALIFAAAYWGTDLIRDRLTTSDFGSARSRFTLAEGALAIIKDHPLTGVGLNNYTLVSPSYDLRNYVAWRNTPPVVHNVFLLITAETGLFGLAGFVVLLIVVIIMAWRIINKAPSNMIWVSGVGIFGSLIALVVHSMVDYALLGSGHLSIQFWLLASLAAAITQRISVESTDSKRAVGFIRAQASNYR